MKKIVPTLFVLAVINSKGGIMMLVISPGHWKIGTGAKGFIDEVTEARNVVGEISKILKQRNIHHATVIDNTSKNVKENLNYLVKEHSKYKNAKHISIHFNSCGGSYTRALGCEVLYKNLNMKELAEQLCIEICCVSKLKNRGAKERKDLKFLNTFPSNGILIEVCFVNSKTDVQLYQKSFKQICLTIANLISTY